MNSGKAGIEITASTARLPAMLRGGIKMVEAFALSAGKALLGLGKQTRDDQKEGIGSWGQHAFGQVVGNLATRGLDAMIQQGKDVLDFNRELVRLGIDLRKTPAQMEPIGKQIRQISNDTGIGAEQVLAAGRAYSDLAGAEAFTMDKMSLIARAAQASGSDVHDMAELLFTMTENMGVPANELENTLGGLINQAKDGSIHFKELSHELVALGATYQQFGVTGRDGMNRLGAMMQIARHGFGSASEAATGVQRIMRSLPQHAAKFASWGVEVFKPGSKEDLDTFDNIIEKIRKSPLASDRAQLIKAFGRTEGERYYQVLVRNYDEYQKLIKAGLMNNVVIKDLGTFVDSLSGRFDVAMERIKNQVAEAFTPERIEAFIGALEGVIDKIGLVASTAGSAFDSLAVLYHVGQSIRGFLTPDDSVLAPVTVREIASYAEEHGVSHVEAAAELQSRHAMYLKARDSIMSGVHGDRTTEVSNRLAAKAWLTPQDTPGAQGARNAADEYFNAIGIRSGDLKNLIASVQKDLISGKIESGKGYSYGPVSELTAFSDALKKTPVMDMTEIIAGEKAKAEEAERYAESMKGMQASADKLQSTMSSMDKTLGDILRLGSPVLSVDGNELARGLENSSRSRRR